MSLRRVAVPTALVVFLFLLPALPAHAQNLVTNGSFDNGIQGWEVVLGQASASAGYATLTTDPTFPIGMMLQCVAVQPSTRYRFSAALRVPVAQSAEVFAAVGFYSDSTCEGEDEEEGDGVGFQPAQAGVWHTQETFVTSPASSRSALVFMYIIDATLSGTAPLTADFDDIILSTDSDPRIAVIDLPSALIQAAGTSGATTTYTLQNVGFSSSQITLSQNGNFFSQSPTSFTLGAGESRTVTVQGLNVAAGNYEGSSIISGTGVPAGLSVPIRMAVAAAPAGPVTAAPAENRVDLVSTSPTGTISGTAQFSNSGTAPIQGILSSDVPWLIPQAGIITIPPGQTLTVTFTIDPARRGDAGSVGSAVGTLFLEYLSGAGAKLGASNTGATSKASVVVVHTVSPGSSPGQIPPIPPGEIALFIPGVAHALGSVGTFISDLSLANLGGSGSLRNINLLFRPIGANTPSLTSTISQLVADRPVLFGDVAKTVFNNTSTSGTLQIRGENVDRISAAANVFNSSNPRGTFGTGIPVFRSDRSAAPGERIMLAGVRADATTHTNIYVQEASGAPAGYRLDFFDQQGVPLGGGVAGNLGGFTLLQHGNVVPLGAVSAVVTNTGASGRLLSYATPVDRASGDTWAVADWNRHYAAGAGAMLVPVAGAVRGANNTYFRTDIAISNTANGAAAGTLRFYSRTGETFDRPISLGAQQSTVVNDVLTTLFGLTGDQVGYLVFTPSSGAVAITSRTYTTVQGQSATFGTGVPTIPLSSGIRLGQRRRFGGIEDASLESITAARPGTFRTNVGLVETSGQPVTVRLILKFSAGTQATATQATAFRDIELAPRQFLQVSAIARTLLQDRDVRYGDLRNMQLDVEVVAGAGSVVVYTSSVDNGTGDSILRID